MKRSAFAIAVITLFVTACASNPVPPQEQRKAVNLTPNQQTVSNIPAWFVKPPKNSDTAIYVVGSGKSNDYSMSEHKAVLDAQSRLAFKLSGEVDALTKDYKRDVNGAFNQTMEQTTQRRATDVKVAGYSIEDRHAVPEGDGFRTYVLLRFPLFGANAIAKQNLQADLDRENAAQAEAQAAAQQAAMEADLKQLKQIKKQIVAPSGAVVSRVTPPPVVDGGITVKITPAGNDAAEED